MKSFMKHAHRESDSMGGSILVARLAAGLCLSTGARHNYPPHLPWLNECYYNYSIQP